MARIALVVAAVAAWLWFSRHRKNAAQHVQAAPVPPAPRPEPVPTDDEVHAVPRDDAPRDERTRLDASAGWGEEPARPGSDRSLLAPPGPAGDETLGVPSWDRPV